MDFAQELIRSHQLRLAALGWYSLKADGIAGPGTEDAFTRFKEAHGLRARSLPGPLTCDLLWSDQAKKRPVPASVAGEPPWLAEARSLLGTREAPGRANNPVIMDWADDLDQWYPGDDIPWCGLFTAICMARGAPYEPQDFNRLGARQWLNYGVKADMTDLPIGGVGVLWRTHKTRSGNGHVGIITAQNGGHFAMIGGNQSDNVTEAWFPRSRLLGVRLPSGSMPPPAPTRGTGTISKTEQ